MTHDAVFQKEIELELIKNFAELTIKLDRLIAENLYKKKDELTNDVFFAARKIADTCDGNF